MLLASQIHGRARDSRQRTTDRGFYTYARFQHVFVDACTMETLYLILSLDLFKLPVIIACNSQTSSKSHTFFVYGVHGGPLLVWFVQGKTRRFKRGDHHTSDRDSVLH